MQKFLGVVILFAAALLLGATDLPKPAIELKLNDGSGVKLKNSGSARVAACICMPEKTAWEAGRGDDSKALRLNNPAADRRKRGNHACVLLPAEGRGDIDLTKPFTVGIWARPEADIDTDGDYVLFSTFAGDHGSGLRLSYGWGALRAAFGDTKTDMSLAAPRSKFPVEKGAWNHFAAVYDGSKLQLYVNGVLAAEKPATIVAPNASTWTIGAFLNGYASPFRGSLADFRIYPVALTAEQVQAEFNRAD